MQISRSTTHLVHVYFSARSFSIEKPITSTSLFLGLCLHEEAAAYHLIAKVAKHNPKEIAEKYLRAAPVYVSDQVYEFLGPVKETEDAKACQALANAYAKQYRHVYVGSIHLLLGILGSPTAAQSITALLHEMEIDPKVLEKLVRKSVAHLAEIFPVLVHISPI